MSLAAWRKTIICLYLCFDLWRQLLLAESPVLIGWQLLPASQRLFNTREARAAKKSQKKTLCKQHCESFAEDWKVWVEAAAAAAVFECWFYDLVLWGVAFAHSRIEISNFMCSRPAETPKIFTFCTSIKVRILVEKKYSFKSKSTGSTLSLK